MKTSENTPQRIISIENKICNNHINVEKFASKKESCLNFKQTQKLIQTLFKAQTFPIKHSTYPEHESFVFNLKRPIDKQTLLSSILKTSYSEKEHLLKFELNISPYATSETLIDAQITLKVRSEFQIELI
ncbi:MAG: hypothetical protein ACPGRE_03255 [Flavobacteriaceae bacterium]